MEIYSIEEGAVLLVFEQIGRRIRQERSKQRMTQEKLAELAGLKESYIGQIERGAKNPSLESLIKIANALGVTVDYLLVDVSEARQDFLVNELVALAKDRNADEIRLMLNINRLVIEHLDRNK